MNQYAVTLLVAIVGAVSVTNCEFVCKQADAVGNFNGSAYLGTWYEYARNPTIYDVTYKCITFNVTSAKPLQYDMAISSRNIYSNEHVDVEAHLKQSGEASLALFSAHIVQNQVSGYFILSVIDIDYESHVIYQRCDFDRKIKYLWIATRERVLSEEKEKALYQILEAKGVESKYLRKVEQDCE